VKHLVGKGPPESKRFDNSIWTTRRVGKTERKRGTETPDVHHSIREPAGGKKKGMGRRENMCGSRSKRKAVGGGFREYRFHKRRGGPQSRGRGNNTLQYLEKGSAFLNYL